MGAALWRAASLQGHRGPLQRAKAVATNPQLATWVSKQRKQYKKAGHGQLTEERLRRLEELGFEWEIGGETWEERLGQLKKNKRSLTTSRRGNLSRQQKPQECFWDYVTSVETTPSNYFPYLTDSSKG